MSTTGLSVGITAVLSTVWGAEVSSKWRLHVPFALGSRRDPGIYTDPIRIEGVEGKSLKLLTKNGSGCR